MREFVLLYSHIKKKSIPGDKNKGKKSVAGGFKIGCRDLLEKSCFFTLLKCIYSVNVIFQYLLAPIGWFSLGASYSVWGLQESFCLLWQSFFLSKTLTLTWCIKADGSGTEGWAALNPLVFTRGKKLHLGTSHGVTNVQWLVPSLSYSQI